MTRLHVVYLCLLIIGVILLLVAWCVGGLL